MGLSRTVFDIKSNNCEIFPLRVFLVSTEEVPFEFCNGGGRKNQSDAPTKMSKSVTILCINVDAVSALDRRADGFAITKSRSACIVC